MKIKEVIKTLKIKENKQKIKNDNSKIYLGVSLELLREVCGVSVLGSSLFQLTLLLKVYRSLPM